jgi:LmbE family N-acetylglucosaminyl deacetylase
MAVPEDAAIGVGGRGLPALCCEPVHQRHVVIDNEGMSMAEWVQPRPDDFERVVVVSPHFDDAAQGAYGVLARHPGSTVVTVLAGRPPAYPDQVTEWDALGGFVDGDDVVGLRQAEDTAAMKLLAATPVWLDFPDHQYLAKADHTRPEAVAPALERVLLALDPTDVFVPFGLGNPDHDMTHRAARILMPAHRDWAWYCYEDAGYSHIPGLLAWRVAALFRQGLWPTPAIVAVDTDMDRKRAVIACYRSQIPPLQADHGLDDRLDAPVPEQYWRLAAPPPGWGGLTDLPG